MFLLWILPTPLPELRNGAFCSDSSLGSVCLSVDLLAEATVMRQTRKLWPGGEFHHRPRNYSVHSLKLGGFKMPSSHWSVSPLKVVAHNSLHRVIGPANILKKPESMSQMQNEPIRPAHTAARANPLCLHGPSIRRLRGPAKCISLAGTSSLYGVCSLYRGT